MTLNSYRHHKIIDTNSGLIMVLLRACTIVKKGELNSFSNVCQMYGLGSQDFFRYLQFRDYFSKKIKSCNPAEPPALIQVFMDAYTSGNVKGLISKLYHSIISLNKDNTDYVKHRWEKELNIL